jgi:MOSC domain-containing protein YiiM
MMNTLRFLNNIDFELIVNKIDDVETKMDRNPFNMKILSVNVGLPRLVEYNGEPVSTGIFKDPVGGVVKVNSLNLEGDRQADLSVHGGYYKAVYVYPSEHYPLWRSEYPDMELPYGMFGENLTTRGLTETDVHIGDRLRIGTAEFLVTQPRLPCYKLGIRFGRVDIIKRFFKSGLSGFYLSIEKTGELQKGDEIQVLSRNTEGDSIAEVARRRFKKLPSNLIFEQ